MDVDFPGDVEHARNLVRQWIDDRVPRDWIQEPHSDRELAELAPDWRALLDSGGWIGASWPMEYGGMGLSALEAAAVWDELYRLPLPILHESLGEVLVGPTLLAWGTEAQKHHYLPGIINGSEVWCQGFSEPGSGSDLASVRTRAVPGDGGGWRLTGSKIWTSGADRADQMFLLARTDPEQPKHRGLSFLLMPMRQDGVDVRPIERADGTAGFCEVFLDGATVPEDGLVGAVNDGWRVATTTLAHERGTSSTTNYWRFKREVDAVAREAAASRVVGPESRIELARAWSQVEILRANYLRLLAAGDRLSSSELFLTAANKLIWSEYHQRFTELRMRTLGLAGLRTDAGSGDGTSRSALTPTQVEYLFARSETIWGGTSEIQRNIVGERALGLPR
jgi:alkylation response protein AidB-like acyl-CoA dehydrogenase